jgi:alpha-ketoglutarate-dependent taurine dioxygenase
MHVTLPRSARAKEDQMQGLRALASFGWMEVDGIHDTEELSRLAASLGRVSDRAIASLSPSAIKQGRSRSFSYHYGLNQFPMHSDTAFWELPARYVVLRSARASNTPTLLLPFPNLRDILKASRAETAIFGVRTTIGSFYGKSSSSWNPFMVRFDPCYMTPANPDARRLAASLSYPDSSLIHRFFWNGANALVIDNWRCLHARAPIEAADTERTLTRIYVMEGMQ